MITVAPKFSCTISHKSSGTWSTPGLLEALRDIAGRGTLSASQIARLLNHRFGTELTRLSIVGKCWRLDIHLRPKAEAARARSTSDPRPVVVPKACLVVKRKRPVRRDLNAPEPKGDVDTGCRYLHGYASERNFCAADRHHPGSSWCEYHAARVWNLAPQAVRRVA